MKTLVLDYLTKSPYVGKTATQIQNSLSDRYTVSEIIKALNSLVKEGKIMWYKDDRRIKYRVKPSIDSNLAIDSSTITENKQL